jgi:hypothetical protein
MCSLHPRQVLEFPERNRSKNFLLSGREKNLRSFKLPSSSKDYELMLLGLRLYSTIQLLALPVHPQGTRNQLTFIIIIFTVKQLWTICFTPKLSRARNTINFFKEN